MRVDGSGDPLGLLRITGSGGDEGVTTGRSLGGVRCVLL